MVIGPRGEAVVAWPDSTTSGAGVVRAASRTAGGNWQRPIVLDWGVCSPQMALDQHGNAIAVWDTYNAKRDIRAAFKPAGRAWRKPATIGSGAGAELALDGKGDAIAVWTGFLVNTRHGTQFDRVQSAFRPAGRSWRRPVTIARGGEPGWPRVAADARGDAIAVWENVLTPDGCCPSEVHAAFRPAGGAWRRAVTLQHNNSTGRRAARDGIARECHGCLG